MLYHLLNILGLANKVFAGIQGDTPPIKLENPLTSDSILILLTKLLEIVRDVGIPVIAIFIVYSGFLFVKAQGNDSKLSEAKATLMWTVIGAAIVLGATVISEVIQATIGGLET
ncbi:MAG: hypothetical protein V1704_00860 [Candidatus Vogelbacteria bacterium]